MGKSEEELKSLNLICDLLINKGETPCISDDYCVYDIKTASNKYFEVKYRRTGINKFQTYLNDGLILEEKKYEALKNLNSYYINVFNFFGVGTYIVVWDINVNKTNFKFKKMLCKQQTDFNKKNQIEKSVTMLKIKDSIQIIEYKNEEYLQVNYNEFFNKLNLNN